MNRLIFIALGALFALPAHAQCPPGGQAGFDAWGWIPASQSGDDWLAANLCQTEQRRQARSQVIISHLGLDENWDFWDDGMLSAANQCNGNTWGGRIMAAGNAAQLTGDHRDNDSMTHNNSPGAILPNNVTVTHWLSQFVSFYVSEEGHRWRCLADGDAGGPNDGFTFASNPFSNSAITLYFPFFWNKTAFDRASTLIHEAAHEFEGHIADNLCANGGSCDTAFMASNAQTMQIIYDSHAVDAYQRQPGSRELTVVNFGGEVCGYLPLLPDDERFALVQVMINKLMTVFLVTPPVSQYPAAARIDNLPSSIYAPGAALDGEAGDTYRIDRFNASRWTCDAVCDVDDYRFPNGERACNEDWQPGNAQINAANRARCNNLNAQVAAGVTPEEHTSLRYQVWNMTPCIQGVAQEVIDQMCDQVKARARHVDTIEANWPLTEFVGYGYSAEAAIRQCQIRFCADQNLDAWDEAAQDVCYEWDDAAGCMPLLCGDLEPLAEDPGREDVEYFEAVMCRASELGRRIPQIRTVGGVCDRVYNDCVIENRYLPIWLEQLAGDDCWNEVLPAGDPLHVERRWQAGIMPAGRFAVADRGPGLLRDECLVKEAECEALQAAIAAAHAKILSIKTRDRLPWERPPGPDPWDGRIQRFDHSFEESMIALSETLEMEDPQVPLARDARILQAAQMPEAQVAMAELVGRDTYLRTGGVHFVDGVMNPAEIALFSGPDAMADPHGLSTEGLDAELEPLAAVSARMADPAWQALRARAGELDPGVHSAHVFAIVNARDGAALNAALEALEADLQALR